MPRLVAPLLAAFAVAAAVASLAAPAAAQPTLAVPIDQSVKVNLGKGVRDIVVGNPMVADVNIMEGGGAVIMGKEYGMTSITAFDEAGRAVFSRKVLVVADDSHRVAYFRGPELNNYTCGDTCQRTPMPGETQRPYTTDVPSYTGYDSRQQTATRGRRQ